MSVCFALSWSAPLCSGLLVCSALCHSGEASSVFQLSQETQSVNGKRKCTPWAEGELTYIDRSSSPSPPPRLVHPPANEDSKSLQGSFGPKPDWSDWSHSYWWWRSRWGYSCTAPIGWRKPILGWNRIPGTPLWGLAQVAETMQAGSRVKACAWSGVGPCVEMTAKLWFLFVVVVFLI